MVELTKFVDGQHEGAHIESLGIKIENTLDFNLNNALAAQTVQVLKVPAGAYVTHVAWEVQTAEGSAATSSIGDDTDHNGWDDSIDMNTVANDTTDHSVDAFGKKPKFYAAANTIDIHPSTALSTAKIVIWAVYNTVADT